MVIAKKPFQTGVVIGVLLMLSPLLGLLVTAYGMFRSFSTLRESGISDPRVLSHSVGLMLYANVVGVILCPIGVTILVLSLVLRARAHREGPPPLPPMPSP